MIHEVLMRTVNDRKRALVAWLVHCLLVAVIACFDLTNVPAKPPAVAKRAAAVDPEKLAKATFGSGCFWCGEAVFQQLKGVHSVVPGYSGGMTLNPSYELVSTGLTGHAEVVQIAFDPEVITYDELLEVFWKSHDPTTFNKQGPDEGSQYRSVIFYHDEQQKESAEKSKKAQAAKNTLRRPIVTQIVELSAFFAAEAYHHNYFNTHRGDQYCAVVVQSKVSKIKKQFPDKLKPNPKKDRLKGIAHGKTARSAPAEAPGEAKGQAEREAQATGSGELE